MKKILGVVALLQLSFVYSNPANFGQKLCDYPQYECVKVSGGQTWEKLFPDENQRDIVQKINRTYNPLWGSKTIAVPKNMVNKTILDFSPFPLRIKEGGEKQVIVDQDKLAWAAYDERGHLVKWGPISSGIDRCPDAARSCRTMTGIFRVFSKENKNCVSNVYPIGRGGAKMPYCMYFHKGFAMHGSYDIPGHRASHGCVRMFTRDAMWLNHDFVSAGSVKEGSLGTKVVVRPILFNEKSS